MSVPSKPYCSAAQSDHSETLAKRSWYRGSCSKYVFMRRSNRRPFCASDSDVARMRSRTCWKLLTWHNAERASASPKGGMACGSGAVHNVGLSDPLRTCRRELTPANGRERIGGGSARRQPGIARTRYLGRSGQASAMCVRKFLAFDRCLRSVDAERNRGYQSDHPIRTLFRPRGRRRHCSRAVPLVSGTSATRCASTRFVRPSVENRGVPLGYPVVCLIRAPVVSAGMLLERPLLRLHPLIQLGSCWGPLGGLFPMICMVGKPCPGCRPRRLFAQMGSGWRGS